MKGTLSLLAVLALTMASACWGQTDTARLQGTVVDSTGGAVAGAGIIARNLETNRVVAVQSSADGEFAIPALPVGRYRLEVSKTGFKTVGREVALQISQVANVAFHLEVGTASEVVTVTAEAAMVDSADSEIGTIVQGRQVTELPLNGRNFTQLATLIPGATRGVPGGAPSGAQGGQTWRYSDSGDASLTVNGLRAQANNFMLDGLDNNETLVNTIVFFPPAEAIEQFRVQTSVASAEFGRAGGGIVAATIKSGTNELHGSAFEFLRNSQLDARPTFAAAKLPFKRNQFGSTMGGPIKKDKLFIFGDYQGLRQSAPLTPVFDTVPTAAFRGGDFSELLTPVLSGLPSPITIKDLLTGQPFPNNVIPPGRINPVGLRYLRAFPLPNTNGTFVNGNYAVQPLQVQSFNDFDVKTDWNIGAKDSLFGRFSFGQDESRTSSDFPQLPAGSGSGLNPNHQRGFGLGETHVFAPKVIHELRLGYIRIFYAYVPPFNDVPLSANLGIPNASTSPLLGGAAVINGGSQLTSSGNSGLNEQPQNTYQVASTTNWVHGAHALRFGANIIRRQLNILRNMQPSGNFDFSNPRATVSTGFSQADILAGFAQSYTIGVISGTVGTRSWETGYFVQDDWHASRRLTMNLGLRYDLDTWPIEVHNRQANFDIVTGQILLAGRDGNSRSFLNTPTHNFAPRIGFAYDVKGDGKTAVRGGYGIFYFIDRGGVSKQLVQNPPFLGSSVHSYTSGFRFALSGAAPNGAVDSTLATGPLPLGTYAGLNLMSPANVNMFAVLPSDVRSYAEQWNVQVQHEIARATVLSVGYIGTAGRHLDSYYNYNQQHFNAPAGVKNFPAMGTITLMESRGNSGYNSLQAQLERRFSNGLQFRAAYTWSHAIDDSEGAFDFSQIQNIFNFHLDRGSSDFDVRHHFVGSWLYELPYGTGRRFGSSAPAIARAILGGWQVNGILTLQTGVPFNLTTPGNPSGIHPDLIAPLVLYDNPNKWFSTSSFRQVPSVGGVLVAPGTLGRNVLVGPGVRTLDASVFRDFRIGERIKAQFRAESFNVANTPVFSNPNGDTSSSLFGRITGTLQSSERQIQFALRVTF